MCPRIKQRGFGMPMVVFILVILTLLAAAIMRLSTTSALSIATEVKSSRALHAAESGAQWAMNQIFPPGGGGGACFASPATLQFTVGALSGCSATVSCTSPGAINGNIHYSVTSSGSCGIETRVIQVKAKN